MEKDVALAIVQNDLEQLVALADPINQKVKYVQYMYIFIVYYLGASKALPVPLYCMQHQECRLAGFTMASSTR